MTTPSHNPHKWTDKEKQVNCSICLLASGMKNCQKCPFYIAPKVNTVSTDSFLKFAEGYLKNIPNGSK